MGSQFCLTPGRWEEKHQVRAGYSLTSKLRFVTAPVLKPWGGRGQPLAAAQHCTWLAPWDPLRLQDEMEFGFLLLRLWNESKSLQQRCPTVSLICGCSCFPQGWKEPKFYPQLQEAGGKHTTLQTGEETWCQHWTGCWLIWAQSPNTAKVFLW